MQAERKTEYFPKLLIIPLNRIVKSIFELIKDTKGAIATRMPALMEQKTKSNLYTAIFLIKSRPIIF